MRKVVLGFSTAYFIALVVLSILVRLASPGPSSQEILGVAIGDYYDDTGIVYLSGRHLDCVRAEVVQSLASTCTVEIEGRILEIHAERSPGGVLSGVCEAYYNGKEWSCNIGSRHVHIHWFANISEPLGLAATQMDALRHKYFFENLPQDCFLTSLYVVPVLTTLVVVVTMVVWQSPRVRSRVVLVPIAVATALVSLVGTLALTFYVTHGFWD